jgi:hypothetical protein
VIVRTVRTFAVALLFLMTVAGQATSAPPQHPTRLPLDLRGVSMAGGIGTTPPPGLVCEAPTHTRR